MTEVRVRSQVFVEPKEAGESENVLQEYASAVTSFPVSPNFSARTILLSHPSHRTLFRSKISGRGIAVGCGRRETLRGKCRIACLLSDVLETDHIERQSRASIFKTTFAGQWHIW